MQPKPRPDGGPGSDPPAGPGGDDGGGTGDENGNGNENENEGRTANGGEEGTDDGSGAADGADGAAGGQDATEGDGADDGGGRRSEEEGGAPAGGGRLSSGIEGLDTVLGGGFLAGDHYLIRGPPGAGKTVLGWQFLVAEGGGDALYVTFEERPWKIRRNAASLGIDLDAVTVLDLSPRSAREEWGLRYDVFDPSAVEYESVSDRIRGEFESTRPRRVLVDPVTQLRYLTPDEYQFRRELLGLADLFATRGAAVLFTSQTSPGTPDDDLQFVSDGVVELGRPNGGRVLDVPKFRGSAVAAGPHAVSIGEGGMAVYPRVVPERRVERGERGVAPSGVAALDDLLHGGIELGTTTLFTGPTGVGKTTVGALYLCEAAASGQRATIYHLEETPETFVDRCHAVGVPVGDLIDEGTLSVVAVTPSLLTVGEFLAQVQADVDGGTAFVMIDGIQGFEKLANVSDGLEQLSALRSYLAARGVTVVLTDEMPNVVGEFTPTKSGETALADNIVFMRYVEFRGELLRAIGVLKKRSSDFDHRLRRFEITDRGVRVGDPISDLAGVLRGDPRVVDDDADRGEFA
jgi:circadian clock protein KaiC